MDKFTVIGIAISTLLIFADFVQGGSVGINFSRQASQKLLPSMVVNMCLSNGIRKVKLLSVNEAVLSAFTRSNLEVMVSCPSNELQFLNTLSLAKAWVSSSITNNVRNREINIRYLGLGVEPFSNLERSQKMVENVQVLAEIVNYTNIALREDGLADQVKVTIPHATDILNTVEKPSDGDFRDDIKENMIRILRAQDAYGGPFMIDIYPLWNINQENRSVEFGFFDGIHNESVQDGDLTYTNMFDLKYDTVLWTLRKNGFGHMKVMVGQIGWPTDSCLGCSVKNAKRFYDGLFKKIASKQGTPLAPGADLDVYLYSLVDENQRNVNFQAFERHYGIYAYDGKPKFNLDFTLQGRRDAILEPAQGIVYLPNRWCVLDEEAAKGKDELLKDVFIQACARSDCSKLGGTCGEIPLNQKVSFAFNMLFQMSNQDLASESKECDFSGLGKIVYEKPQAEPCEFPVEILSTLFINSASNVEMQATLGAESSSSQTASSPFNLILILLLSCLFLYYN